MGGNLCSDSHNSINDFNNENKIIKKYTSRQSDISPTIQENVSIYSNSDIFANNNNKHFNNETDVNYLKSSIFDNEENDNEHYKKYEQEINTYDHPYIFNQNNKNNYNYENYENNDELSNSNNDYNEYTFKNSPARNYLDNQNNNNRTSDFNKSSEFISNNKNSFKKFEILRNKQKQKNEDICSFGKNNNNEYDNSNSINNSNNISNSDIEIIENERDNNLIINEFINKNEAKKKINNFDPKIMNKYAMNQLIKIQKKIRKSIYNNNNNLKLKNINKDKIDELLISLNVINSSNDKTILNSSKDFCVRYFNNGSIYIGQIKNNKCNGYGKYKTQDNDLEMGIFKNNCLHEYGIIERRNINSIYEGELDNNLFTGIGIESFKDGAAYYGSFYKNNKDGIGTYIWSDDTQYQGQWKNGEMNGFGIFIDGKRRNYEGSWVGGKMEGAGVFRWGDGRKYLGFFKKDKRNGFGIYIWKKPMKIYVGFWKEGEQNGYGKVYTPFKEKSYIWNKGKKIKNFNNNNNMLQEIKRGNNPYEINKISFFKMSFDDLLSFMLEI